MNKNIHRIIAAPSIALVLTLAGCGESAQQKAAKALDASIDSAYDAGNYSLTLLLIDSLNKTYPRQIDIRKASDYKRAKAMEGSALQLIPKLDTTMDSLRNVISEMEDLFIVEQPSRNLPGYAVYKGTESLMAHPTLQARANIDAQDISDTPWTLATNAGKNIGLNSVTLVRAGETFTMKALSADGTTGTINPEDATPLASALFNNPPETDAIVTFNGTKGKTTAKLTPSQLSRIALTWHYADLRQQLHKVTVLREKMSRQLQLSRDRAANTLPEQINKK